MGIGGGGGKGGQAQGLPKQLFPRRLQVFSKSPKSMGKSNSFFISPVLFNQGHRTTVSS